jgi:hypothetical protein
MIIMKINRVFISSVMQDYEDRRETARKAIRELGMEPVFAERLEADPNSPRDAIHNSLSNCDAMVGIYGKRYGTTGTKSGKSPTEEEYDWARELWKPIYVFIDKLDQDQPDQQQQSFLNIVQNWDLGVVRKEFHSMNELKTMIKQSLTGKARSPLYQQFLSSLSRCMQGYRETSATKLPAFDLVLHRPGSAYEAESLFAVVDGDMCDKYIVDKLVINWNNAIKLEFQTGFWRNKHATGSLVIAIEKNPFKHNPKILRRRIDYLVDLKSKTAEKAPESWLTRPPISDPTKKILISAIG